MALSQEFRTLMRKREVCTSASVRVLGAFFAHKLTGTHPQQYNKKSERYDGVRAQNTKK